MRKHSKNSEVVFVAPPATEKGSPSFKKGVVIEVMAQSGLTGPGTVRIDVTPRTDKGEAANPKDEPLGHHTAIADYSDAGEVGTFHYPDETKAIKADAGSASKNGK
jgi:hypothetical protein